MNAMAYRQYTKCYEHTAGDEPFNESDLAGTVLALGGVALLGAILSFAFGFFALGGVFMGVGYAGTIAEIARKWLYHRLVCLGTEPKCAVGVVQSNPTISDFGEFDNDEFFDLRLMPHRPNDDYKSDNTAYKSGNPGPSLDGKTELQPENDVYLDGFQGQTLMRPSIADLPYKLDRSKLHCEAEGNFWQAMLDFAALLGLAVGVGSGLGALGGAALGGAIGCFFGPIGCLIGAIIGAILGALLGGAAGAFIGAEIAFHSDPGDVEDANVGDASLGPISEGDKVVVYGIHVYDGFHEGWHEIHPLMKVIKLHPDSEASGYTEWDPDFNDPAKLPMDLPGMPATITGLTVDDMKKGLASKKFFDRAVWLRDTWCGLLTESVGSTTAGLQATEEHRWTIHPNVDGCEPDQPDVPK
jgi:hypothetical protein